MSERGEPTGLQGRAGTEQSAPGEPAHPLDQLAATVAAVSASEPPAEAPTQAPALDTHSDALRLSVRAAFAVGWQVGELLEMARAHKKGGGTGSPLDHDEDRTRLLAEAITAGLCRLQPHIKEVSLRQVDLPQRMRRTSNIATIADLGDATGDLEAFDYKLRVRLTAADFRLGKAYRLGRELAETCISPEDADEFDEMFGTRMVGIRDRLTDLATALPPHASRSVALSLRAWERWAADPDIDHADVNWKVQWPAVRAALRRQGELWRSLLSGEKDGRDMLKAEDYVDATGRLLRHTARLMFPAKRPAIALAVGAVVLILFIGGAALLMFDKLTTVAGAAAALGALGITQAGIRRFVGSRATQLQDWLWEGELDFAIANAITIGPAGWSGTVETELPAAGATPSAASYLQTLEAFREAVRVGRPRAITAMLAPRVTFDPEPTPDAKPAPLRSAARGSPLRTKGRRRAAARAVPPAPSPSGTGEPQDPVEWLRANAARYRITEVPEHLVAGEPGRFMAVLSDGAAHVWRVREGKIHGWAQYRTVEEARTAVGLPALANGASRQSTDQRPEPAPLETG